MTEQLHGIDPVMLALETSQREGSVALRSQGGEIRSISFPCGARNDDHLLPSIDELFREAELSPASLDALAVSIGPGGFTGLRIAVSTAKGIAEVTGCQVIAVPSAFVAAESLRAVAGVDDRVVVVSAAKASTCWMTSLVMESGGNWVQQGEGGIQSVDPPSPEVIALCEDAYVLADEHVPDGFLGAVRSRARHVETPHLSAEGCLFVAMGLLQRGETIDPLSIEPLYPREPEAVTLWKQRADKTAK